MRMMKCYLANTTAGRFVTAKEAGSAGGGILSCTTCGCRLLLNVGTLGEEPWFEHDQHTVTMNVLMKCAHLDPQVKEEARQNQLLKVVGALDAPATVLSWYCALCGNHYHGNKLCVSCGTGIYSIEEANWRANYA